MSFSKALSKSLDNLIERLWRSVKYDYVYLNPTNDGNELYLGLREYFDYYKHSQRHQGIGRMIPISSITIQTFFS